MEFTVANVVQILLLAGVGGGLVWQAKNTAKLASELATRQTDFERGIGNRVAASEKAAAETAVMLNMTARHLERVVARLDEHETEGATMAERVTNHGLELERLRAVQDRCSACHQAGRQQP